MVSKGILDVKRDINGKIIRTYLGNPKLKAEGVVIGYSQEMLEEYIKCKQDIIYFAENYFYHTHPDLGIKRIELYDYQRDILRNFQNKRFNILLQSRQSGKCVTYKTKIRIRDIKNKKEKIISIGDFYKRIDASSKKMGGDDKFIEKLQNFDFEVFTDTGWKSFGGIGLTKPFEEYTMFTKTKTLSCADNHLVLKKNDKNPSYVKNIKTGDVILTEDGSEEVLGVLKTDNKKPMYDFLNVSGKYYYTNGILSHNTTVSTIYIVWYLMFNDSKTIAILANKEKTAIEIMSRVKLGLEELPFGLQQGVVTWNETSIEFDNKSRVLGFSTSSDAARGLSANALFIDECAFVPRWDDFYSSVYPIISTSKESKVILVSTPNGKNHFYDIWTRANKDENNPMRNEYTPYRVTWDMVPGRDEKWKALTIKNFGQERFDREYNCEFDSKAGTLVSGEVLKDISKKYKDKMKCNIPGLNDYEKYVYQYEEVKEKNCYVIGADTSTTVEEGKGSQTCFQVLDVTRLPYRQVCTIHIDKGLNYRLFPYILYALGKYYNYAFLFVENNEGSGREANRILEDLGYENMFWDNSVLAGVRTTMKSKKFGCENLKNMIENYNIILNDFNTLSQLGNFVHKGNSFKADLGYDDAVMAMVMAIYFLSLTDNIYLEEILLNAEIRDYTELTIKTLKNNKYMKDEVEDVTPREIREMEEQLEIFKAVLGDSKGYMAERGFKNLKKNQEQPINRNTEIDIF